MLRILLSGFPLLAVMLSAPAQPLRPSASLLEEWDIRRWPATAFETGPGGRLFAVREGRLPLAAETPFIAFSAAWDDAGGPAPNSSLSVAWSADSLHWSDGQTPDIDPHAVGTRKPFTTGLVFLPPQARFYRLRITTNLQGQGRLHSLLVNFFSPGAPPGPPPPATQEPNAPAACPCDKPAVVTRAGWNCPQTNNPGYGYTTVTHLVVHHSAGANTSSDWPAVVLSIWNSHVNTNGWADIGYNYLIDPQGRLYEGRGGGDNVTGAHFCGTNSGTMGTCLLGTYTNTSASDTARSMLTRLLAWKACGSSINPVGASWHTASARNLNHISGHRDGCATECPGAMTYAELPALRTAVANHIAACNTPTALRDIPGLQAFRITPNPVRNGQATATFDLATPGSLRYEVYTVDGRLLHAAKARPVAGHTRIPLQGLEKAGKGTVYLVFRLDRGSFTQRVVLE